MLTYHNIPHPEPQVDDDDLAAELLVTGVDRAWFDLSIDLNETPGSEGVDGVLRYQKARFDKATARRLAAEFLAILEFAARTPDEPFL
jgi:hypothetical protein